MSQPRRFEFCWFRWLCLWAIVASTQPGPISARAFAVRAKKHSFVSNDFGVFVVWCATEELPTTVLHSVCIQIRPYANAGNRNKEIHRVKLFECCVTLFSWLDTEHFSPSFLQNILFPSRCVSGIFFSDSAFLPAFSWATRSMQTELERFKRRKQKIHCVRKKF